jgi:diguanylate cyclase (GGDEF)-like protein
LKPQSDDDWGEDTTLESTHGHLAGNYILSSLSGVITESLRETELAARYGGEEFAVIFPDTYLYYAATAAERLLSDVRNNQYEFEGKQLGITASIGIAAITWQDDATGICARADRALYAAKAAGRDRGYVHDGQQCQPSASITFTTVLT